MGADDEERRANGKIEYAHTEAPLCLSRRLAWAGSDWFKRNDDDGDDMRVAVCDVCDARIAFALLRRSARTARHATPRHTHTQLLDAVALVAVWPGSLIRLACVRYGVCCELRLI